MCHVGMILPGLLCVASLSVDIIVICLGQSPPHGGDEIGVLKECHVHILDILRRRNTSDISELLYLQADDPMRALVGDSMEPW